jgi:RNA ligase
MKYNRPKPHIPTFQEAKAITDASEAFYFTTSVVNGYTVYIFNYRLATYDDFVKYDAYELRGLTFIENNNQYERFILLEKFFNIDQTPATLTSALKELEITAVNDKLDGSIIQFVKFPNGLVQAKSKMSFISEQAIMAQTYYERNIELQTFVASSFNDGFMPIFELVGRKNTIVIDYSNKMNNKELGFELRLIQIRNNNTGEYIKINNPETIKYLAKQGIACAEHFKKEKYPELYTVDSLNALSETIENIEGWVVQFSNGLKVKKKTAWYNRLHGSISELREDLIIELILNEQIDDILGMLNEGTEKRQSIEEIIKKVSHEFNHLVVEYKELRRKFFQDFAENRKMFVHKHQHNKMFSSVMKGLNKSGNSVEELAEAEIKKYILNKTKTLSKAKIFLEDIKI